MRLPEFANMASLESVPGTPVDVDQGMVYCERRFLEELVHSLEPLLCFSLGISILISKLKLLLLKLQLICTVRSNR